MNILDIYIHCEYKFWKYEIYDSITILVSIRAFWKIITILYFFLNFNVKDITFKENKSNTYIHITRVGRCLLSSCHAWPTTSTFSTHELVWCREQVHNIFILLFVHLSHDITRSIMNKAMSSVVGALKVSRFGEYKGGF